MMPISTILVVDDEPIITQTLVLILNNFGHEFLAVGSTNAQEALAIVRGIHPDLVILDAVMPEVHGLEHAIEMREKYGCKVLMISGHGASASLFEELGRAGHAPFEIMAKPIQPMELVEKIREMLRKPPLQPAWQNPLSFKLQ
jgi:DNA-binding response OmpR family regulator